MNKKDIEERTENLLKPIAEACGVSIYDVEYVKEGSDMYLRAYIDKEGGVTIDDCESVSRALNDKLDEEDYIADAYILEVSSPGLGRKLTKPRHFVQSIGQEVELKTYKAVDGDKEFTGILTGYDNGVITVDIDGKEKTFDKDEVSSIRLTFDF
ncbi:MAG: ribosome maturation factor RimP [Lachnospiraceae bacterium]|nr:ribosome maturation factor RimP [Lachnospiraceae bacterium]